jgi:hypothetical protein
MTEILTFADAIEEAAEFTTSNVFTEPGEYQFFCSRHPPHDRGQPRR